MIEAKTEYKKLRCVYEIRCLKNNYTYIGQTTDLYRRAREHRFSLNKNAHRNHALQCDYNKFGSDAFEIVILSESNDSELDDLERKEISSARAAGRCYNVFGGGKTSFTVTDEFRDKISRAHKGRIVSEETKKLKSQRAKEQWKNNAYRETMRKSARNQWNNLEYRKKMQEIHTGTTNACGKKLTEDIVRSAIKEYKSGDSFSEIAKRYDMSYCAMRNAILGISWKNIDRT